MLRAIGPAKLYVRLNDTRSFNSIACISSGCSSTLKQTSRMKRSASNLQPHRGCPFYQHEIMSQFPLPLHDRHSGILRRSKIRPPRFSDLPQIHYQRAYQNWAGSFCRQSASISAGPKMEDGMTGLTA